MSPAVAFPFAVESSGITLLSDESIDVTGPDITSIRCQGTIYVCSADNGLKLAVFSCYCPSNTDISPGQNVLA
jgi:hypothetical protein